MKYKWTNIIIAALVVIVIAAGASYAFFANKTSAPTSNEPAKATTTVAKSDYKEESKEALRTIDKFFEDNSTWAVDEISRIDSKQGSMHGFTRELTVKLPSGMSADTAANKLKTFVEKNKLKYISQADDDSGDYGGLFVQVGMAGGFVTDKITLKNTAKVEKKEKPKKATGKGKMAIVIDDAGYTVAPLQKMLTIDAKLTFAILPYRPYSSESLRLIKNRGQQAILHLPMQPLNQSAQSEKNTISTDMSASQIQSTTIEALDSLPGVIGVNNHQGSRATGDPRVMREVLSVLKERSLFFVDSFTQPNTVGYKVAQEMGVPSAINNSFMDGQADVEYIRNRFRQAGQQALKDKNYIVICHVRPATADALHGAVAELQEMGVELVYVSEMLN